jgi:carbamoyl-phosphate synthase large subunit
VLRYPATGHAQRPQHQVRPDHRSGPIVIGQACEFDYSGSQASRSLRNEGIEVTLINSNPATIMTDPVTADNVYLKPLTTESIEEILKKHKIDAVLPTMGGQTALNLAIECEKLGIWKEHNVRMIGVDTKAIDITENREQFRLLMERIGVPMAPSKTVTSFLEGKKVAQEFGFPLVIRASYTLGGAGASFVKDPAEFDKLLKHGLQISPIHEVMIDKALLGWKEYELELLRDKDDNVTIICSIENFDPMGIHTGDSITVAPAMTLSDRTYQRMRTEAIKMMRAIGDFAGGCNVQFAVSPDEHEHIYAIEINPRVSRSSALASKATGYPIAKIASKLAIGYRLDELENPITGTSAFFEPTLDYVIVKVPRWNFDKFEGSDRRLGVQMKSVGETMGIGRSFQEALQKACQSLEIRRNGLGADGKETTDSHALLESLANPSWHRLFHIYDAIKLGIPFKRIQELTHIDLWFLKQIEDMIKTEKEVEKYTLDTIPRDLLFEAKQKGYADRQVAHLLGCLESQVYKKRNELGIKRVYKLVDTCAGEFPAKTPYYYSTFEEENESVRSDRKKIVVLGSGPNRIGQGIEFDYCCVHGVLAAKELGYETIMINCNPETVSTDFDTADKLYFEPVFWEHIYDIIQHEQPEGVIVQLGGQTALKIAEKLEKYGITIIGTSFAALDIAEDRERFSSLLRELGIPYPKFGAVRTAEEAVKLSQGARVPAAGAPQLRARRPEDEDRDQRGGARGPGARHPAPDARQQDPHRPLPRWRHRGGERFHLRRRDGAHHRHHGAHRTGRHPQRRQQRRAPALRPQRKGDPADPRAHAQDRAGPAHRGPGEHPVRHQGRGGVRDRGQPARQPHRALHRQSLRRALRQLGHQGDARPKLKDFQFKPRLDGYAIKVPVFSFDKFPNVDKSLGPEMKSTGEAIYFIKDLKDPFFRQVYGERSMYLSR